MDRRSFGYIFGLAAPFEDWTHVPKDDAWEQCARGCFTEALQDAYIELRVNHQGPVLATLSDGAFSLFQTEEGLHAHLDLDALDDRSAAEAIAAYAEQRKLCGWSMTYLRDEAVMHEERYALGTLTWRTLHRVGRLKEVSLIVAPQRSAYTTWARWSLDERSTCRRRQAA